MEKNKNKQEKTMIFPENSSNLIISGIDLMNNYQFAEAIIEFDKAISINPKQLKAYYKKGLCLYNMEKFDEAMEIWDNGWNLEWQK